MQTVFNYMFSPSTLAFYRSDVNQPGTAQGKSVSKTSVLIPSDAKPITDAQWAIYIQNKPIGKKLGADNSGMPAWVPESTTPDALKLRLNSYRISRQVAGVYFKPINSTLGKTYHFSTDSDSQIKIVAAYTQVQMGKLKVASWPDMTHSFVQLSGTDLVAFLTFVINYIEQCYDRQAWLARQIDAGILPDITLGWPSQGPGPIS